MKPTNKKLNAELLEILAVALKKGNTQYTKECDAHVISEMQAQNFRDAQKPSSETPAYMRAFWKNYSKPLTGGTMVPAFKIRGSLEGARFVFTSAQNNTEVHHLFLKTLESYCKINDSQLCIAKFAYNKNGFQNGVADKDEIHYAPVLEKYFKTESLKVADGLVWCGELNILPTAKYPLSGFEQYTGKDSSIIPCSRIAMQSIAVPKGAPLKSLFGTGTVTLRNYIQKKAGQKAEEAHCYGALIVEIDNDGIAHCRQIQTDDRGHFQDLKTIYYPDGTTKGGRIPVLNLGDIHSEKSDQNVLDCIFNSIIPELEPETIMLHDLFDMSSRNHHNRNNPHFMAKGHFSSTSVEKDLQITASFLNNLDRACGGLSKLMVVESNHDLALESWLQDTRYDFRFDPQNALTYLNLQTYCYTCLQEKQPLRLLDYALSYYLETSTIKNTTFLETDEHFEIVGIKLDCHGHVGVNGSRGTPKQFEKLNIPMNTGHTHSPSIYGNVYTAGVTGSYEMGYNIGPSSWQHTHILTYETGFRTLITQLGHTFSNWKA